MDKPLITVVVPLYNSAPYLDSIVSLLNRQTFSRFEAVFVCDKSPDKTEALLPAALEKAAFSFSWHVNPERLGVGKARDYALDNSLVRGEFVLFLDADDAFPADYLQRLYDSATQHNADIAICGFRRIDRATGRVIVIDMCGNPPRISVSQHESLLQLINPAPWNKLIRVSKIGDIRFGLSIMEDAVFMALLFPRCRRISFINEPLYDYFLDPNSLSNANGLMAWGVGKDGFRAAKEYAEQHLDVYRGFDDYFTALAFMRVGIGATSRACLAKGTKFRQRRNIITESRHYLDNTFPGWRKNRFLAFSVLTKRGIKGFLLWRCRLLYKWHMFGWFVFQYKLFTGIFKKDIKW